MRPVLFLDIDGVLNSTEWVTRRTRSPILDSLSYWERLAEEHLDPDAVSRLNDVFKATKCLVVVSSTWKRLYPVPKLTRMLRHHGFHGHVFGTTAYLYNEVVGRKNRYGWEIDWWLKEIDEPCTFAILDSGSDLEPHLGRLVTTNNATGLTDQDAERLIELLRQPADTAYANTMPRRCHRMTDRQGFRGCSGLHGHDGSCDEQDPSAFLEWAAKVGPLKGNASRCKMCGMEDGTHLPLCGWMP